MSVTQRNRVNALVGLSGEKLKKALQNEIQQYVKNNTKKGIKLSKDVYKKWKVGVTNNPYRRYGENLPKGKKRLTYWQCWQSESKIQAEEIESYFCQKGFSKCSNKYNEQENTIYVYVFLIPKLN